MLAGAILARCPLRRQVVHRSTRQRRLLPSHLSRTHGCIQSRASSNKTNRGLGDDSNSAASVMQEDFVNLRPLSSCLLVFAGCSLILAQSTASTPGQSFQRHFDSINHKVLEMAREFPEDKYDYRLKPEMRSFGELIVHIASGNVYAAKAGRGEKINWDDLDPKDYKTKAAIVALMHQSITDADATLKSWPNEAFAKGVEPWLDVTEHTAEHYGLLVAYYRANGLVPPASRLKK